ncbi:transposase [Streptomyces achromogenes]|uniref:transposase n=1 Tax=Streptomyces achromogenes TaxID=67255 RepID=UPI003718205A
MRGPAVHRHRGQSRQLPGRGVPAPGFGQRVGGCRLALVLPESWDPASAKADPGKVARRTTCGIPTDVGHVEKWQPALDMIK